MFNRVIVLLFVLIGVSCSPQVAVDYPQSTATKIVLDTNTPVIKQRVTPDSTSTPLPKPTATKSLSVASIAGLTYCLDGELWGINANNEHQYVLPVCKIEISPNNELAFYENFEGVWIINILTEEKNLIIDFQEDSSEIKFFHGAIWSPDSESLFYLESTDGWLTDIWVANILTGEKRNITNTPDRVEWELQYWGGSEKLLFTSFVYNDEKRGPGQLGYMTVVDTDGDQYQILSDEMLISSPTISPDGSKLALPGGEIYQWDTGLKNFKPNDQTDLKLPAWSDDGEKLAWSVRVKKDADNLDGIGVFDFAQNTFDVFHLYQSGMGEGLPEPPMWSPDGQWLSLEICDFDESKTGIWIIKADGTDEHFLGNFNDVFWSFDSRRIAYTNRNTESGSQIWFLEVGDWQSVQSNLPENSKIVSWKYEKLLGE